MEELLKEIGAIKLTDEEMDQFIFTMMRLQERKRQARKNQADNIAMFEQTSDDDYSSFITHRRQYE